MVSARLIRQIEEILRKNSDPNLHRVLFEGEPPFNEIVNLLAKQIENADFTPRYLLPGKSGAKVLLLIRAPRRVDSVIKLGSRADISKERACYENWVRNRLDPNIYPDLSPRSATTKIYSCLEYNWAGGTGSAVSLRSFLIDQKPDTKDLQQILQSLFTLLPKWHHAHMQKEPRENGEGGYPTVHPFDTFYWNEEGTAEIKKAVKSFIPDGINPDSLIDIVDGGRELKSRLGAPTRTDNASIATISHGDLNSNNVLVLRDNRGCRPMLIDFASIQIDRFCPARDWARLARDIKFIALSQLVKGNANSFDTLLGVIDEQRQTDIPKILEPCIDALRIIETNYVQFYGHASTCPEIEYVYHLLCWNLAFLDTDEFKDLSPNMKEAVLRSALRTLQRVEDIAKGPRDRSLVLPNASALNNGADNKRSLDIALLPFTRPNKRKFWVMAAVAIIMLVVFWVLRGFWPNKVDIHQSSHHSSSPNIVNKGGKVMVQINADPNNSSATEKSNKREKK